VPTSPGFGRSCWPLLQLSWQPAPPGPRVSTQVELDTRHVPRQRHHVPRAGARVDSEGFTIVESRRRGRAWVLRRRPVPSSLVGLCFNCLGGGHVTAVCRLLSRCLHCRCAGHRARDCKRGRLPVRGAAQTKGTPRRRPLREQPRRLSSTVSGSNPDNENSGGALEPHMGPG
jgi:hypothetical protein